MKKLFLLFSFFLVLVSLVPIRNVFSAMGVGVGTGKIVVEDKLKSGEIYELPPLSVINTGDEESQYGAGISHKTIEGKLKPSEEWFSFDPKEFHLKPGESKLVTVKLSIPLKSIPGDYFCYLEGFPIKKSESGQTMIGISAAAKLSFTIAPSNPLEGVFYRIVSLWKQGLPWTNITAGAVFVFIIIRVTSRYLNIKIGLKKKSEPKNEDNE